jgi:outer membrane lipoprotein LolB
MMRRLAALSLVALLCACAIAPPLLQPADVTAIREFELSGRVAVRLESRGYSARMTWLHASQGEQLRLFSPLGTVLATIEADADGATLATADKQTFHSSDVQGLTREVLGWDLPLEGLRHWVVARPDPATPVDSQRRDPRGRLISLSQRGWQVAYQAYAGDGVLPSSLTLTYGSLKIKLLIDRWAALGT